MSDTLPAQSSGPQVSEPAEVEPYLPPINPAAPPLPIVYFTMHGMTHGQISHALTALEPIDVRPSSDGRAVAAVIGPAQVVFPMNGGHKTTLELSDAAERIAGLFHEISSALLARAGRLPADNVGEPVEP